MQLFYTPLLNPSITEFMLDEEESKHAVRVLRKQNGDTLHLVDGKGGLYEAEILDAHPKRTTLKIRSVQENFEKPSYHFHIAVAPTKNIDRIEWFLEKATEIGVQEITPLISEHSERKEVKLDRLNKVIVSAMKQSLKAYLPQLNPAISFSQFIHNQSSLSENVKMIAHCEDGEKQYLNQVVKPGDSAVLLIGPEGDFSPAEIALASANGFKAISLGDARLRTETAALAAVMEIALINR